MKLALLVVIVTSADTWSASTQASERQSLVELLQKLTDELDKLRDGSRPNEKFGASRITLAGVTSSHASTGRITSRDEITSGSLVSRDGPSAGRINDTSGWSNSTAIPVMSNNLNDSPLSNNALLKSSMDATNDERATFKATYTNLTNIIGVKSSQFAETSGDFVDQSNADEKLLPNEDPMVGDEKDNVINKVYEIFNRKRALRREMRGLWEEVKQVFECGQMKRDCGLLQLRMCCEGFECSNNWSGRCREI